MMKAVKWMLALALLCPLYALGQANFGSCAFNGVNAQAGTSYTVITGDKGKLITFNNVGAVAVTLPQATGFGAQWCTFVQNLGAGAVTITPTTSTINLVATLTLNSGQGVTIFSDATNYQIIGGVGSSITNAAGNNVITKSNGTNLVASTCTDTGTTINCTANQLSVGPADTATSGAIGLNGKTSGTATATAPAVAGTSTNPVIWSNALQVPAGASATPGYTFTGDTNSGFFNRTSGFTVYSGAGNNLFQIGPGALILKSSVGLGYSSGDPISGQDSMLSRKSAALLSFDSSTLGNTAGFLKSAQTLQVAGANFTTTSVTLAAVTGLTFTAPVSSATNWSFRCDLIYSEATAATADLFGIITTQTAPTNLLVGGEVLTTNAGVQVDGNAIITTATSTTVVTATPSASGAIGTGADMFIAHIWGTLEAPSNASPTQVAIAVATGNASDALTVYRGSACWWY